MRSIRYLVQRNASLFMNNKSNILLSAASIPIVVSLYVFFLRDFLISVVTKAGIDGIYTHELTDRMMLAGLLVVINTTTSFGIIQICVNDSATGIRKDFLSAPITPFSMLLGYWITSIAASCFFTFVTALGGEIMFETMYGRMLPIRTIWTILFIILFSSCINSGILLCMAHKINNTTTFSTFANLYGTVIGFLAGAYLPYYFYPVWLKSILLWFPPTQLTSILRREYISVLSSQMERKGNIGIIRGLYQNFGLDLKLKSEIIPVYRQWSILMIALALLLLYLWICSYEKSEKSIS